MAPSSQIQEPPENPGRFTGVSQQIASAHADPPALFVDHNAPLLAEQGAKASIEITAFCEWSAENEAGADLIDTCEPETTLFVRELGQRDYKPIAVTDPDDPFVSSVDVPIGKRGIEYYISVTDHRSGLTETVPEAAATDPNVIYALPATTSRVQLPAHTFGDTAAGALVAEVPFGSGVGQAAVTELAPDGEGRILGPQALTVTGDGSVLLLDNFNERVLDLGRVHFPAVASDVPRAADDIVWSPGATVVFGRKGTSTFVGEVALSGYQEWTEFTSDPSYVRLAPQTDNWVAGVVFDGDRRGFAEVSRSGVSSKLEGGPRAQIDSYLIAESTEGRSAPEVQIGVAGEPGPRDVTSTSVIYQVDGNDRLVGLVLADRVVEAWKLTSPTVWGPTPWVSSHDGALTALSYVTDGVVTEARVIELRKGAASDVMSFPLGSYADHSFEGSLKLHEGAIYQLTSSDTATLVYSYNLKGESS